MPVRFSTSSTSIATAFCSGPCSGMEVVITAPFRSSALTQGESAAVHAQIITASRRICRILAPALGIFAHRARPWVFCPTRRPSKYLFLFSLRMAARVPSNS